MRITDRLTRDIAAFPNHHPIGATLAAPLANIYSCLKTARASAFVANTAQLTPQVRSFLLSYPVIQQRWTEPPRFENRVTAHTAKLLATYLQLRVLTEQGPAVLGQLERTGGLASLYPPKTPARAQQVADLLRPLANEIAPHLAIVGILLHDIGKIIDEATHAFKGAQLIEEHGLLKPLGLPAGDQRIITSAIKYHNLFGDQFLGDYTFEVWNRVLADPLVAEIKLAGRLSELFQLCLLINICDIGGYNVSLPYYRRTEHFTGTKDEIVRLTGVPGLGAEELVRAVTQRAGELSEQSILSCLGCWDPGIDERTEPDGSLRFFKKKLDRALALDGLSRTGIVWQSSLMALARGWRFYNVDLILPALFWQRSFKGVRLDESWQPSPNFCRFIVHLTTPLLGEPDAKPEIMAVPSDGRLLSSWEEGDYLRFAARVAAGNFPPLTWGPDKETLTFPV